MCNKQITRIVHNREIVIIIIIDIIKFVIVTVGESCDLSVRGRSYWRDWPYTTFLFGSIDTIYQRFWRSDVFGRFLPRNAMRKGGTSCRPVCVCPCVRHMAKDVIKIISHPGKGAYIGKVHTLDIAPLRESSPQKRSGMARVLRDISFTCTVHTHTFCCSRNEPYLSSPSQL